MIRNYLRCHPGKTQHRQNARLTSHSPVLHSVRQHSCYTHSSPTDCQGYRCKTHLIVSTADAEAWLPHSPDGVASTPVCDTRVCAGGTPVMRIHDQMHCRRNQASHDRDESRCDMTVGQNHLCLKPLCAMLYKTVYCRKIGFLESRCNYDDHRSHANRCYCQ